MQIEQIERRGMFQQVGIVDGKGSAEEKTAKTTDILAGSVPQTQTVTYGKPQSEQAMTLEDIQNSASVKDAVQMKNEMVVGANTATSESAAAMKEDGFSLDDTDIHTVVTETDKIQMQLAKAGVDTSYFGDSLSPEQIAEIAGSKALAVQYESALEQADAIEPLEEGSLKYMLDNDLAPTISNLYQAQYNGAKGQVSQPDEQLDEEMMTQQFLQVITGAGLVDSQENLDAAKWLAANDIPVTGENITYLQDLKTLQMPEAGQLLAAMKEAVSEGKTPADAFVLEDYSPASRAQSAMDVIDQVSDEELAYVIGEGQELTIENLKNAKELNAQGKLADYMDDIDWDNPTRQGLTLLEARRILEETRLSMTTEANYGLIRRGMEIEIRPLVQLVDDLKSQENSYYENLLGAVGSDPVTLEQTDLFKSTIETAQALAAMPAYALGSPAYDGTVENLAQEGAALQSKLEAAGEAYETMQSTPRADLGDSIAKAFRNVDDILQDLGMETTAENQRAVRILAYNQLSITEESVNEMKAADGEVQQAFDSLKPAVVREMIRSGINPLQLQMGELNEQAQEIRESLGGNDEMTKYSEFLWRLEQNNEISQSERDSYIGIYRLINQVEAGDGAAIGALVAQGAPVTMENLLHAIRSDKKSGMDYRVDDRFGGVDGKFNGASISEQINAAYEDDQLETLREAAEAPVRIYELLEDYSIPTTANNVIAMQQMMANPNGALRKFFQMADDIEKDDPKSELMDEIAQIKEKLLHDMGESIQAPEELADAQQTLAEVAEHCGQTVMYSQGMTRLDVRQLQMAVTQLHLGAVMTREERYQIPIMTSDGAVGVNIKIVRGGEKKGSVRITMDSEGYGKVAAELTQGQEGIRGYVASDSRAGVDRLRRELEDEPETQVIFSEHLDLPEFERAQSAEGDSEVETKELYQIAEKMIRFFREGLAKPAQTSDI
jgi:hypothetical protein